MNASFCDCESPERDDKVMQGVLLRRNFEKLLLVTVTNRRSATRGSGVSGWPLRFAKTPITSDGLSVITDPSFQTVCGAAAGCDA